MIFNFKCLFLFPSLLSSELIAGFRSVFHCPDIPPQVIQVWYNQFMLAIVIIDRKYFERGLAQFVDAFIVMFVNGQYER